MHSSPRDDLNANANSNNNTNTNDNNNNNKDGDEKLSGSGTENNSMHDNCEHRYSLPEENINESRVVGRNIDISSGVAVGTRISISDHSHRHSDSSQIYHGHPMPVSTYDHGHHWHGNGICKVRSSGSSSQMVNMSGYVCHYHQQQLYHFPPHSYRTYTPTATSGYPHPEHLQERQHLQFPDEAYSLYKF